MISTNAKPKSITFAANIHKPTRMRKIIKQTNNTQASLFSKQGFQIAGLAAAMFLGGCMSKVGELPEEVQVKVPEKWQPKPTIITPKNDSAENTAIEPVAEPKPVIGGWLHSFNDAGLNAHVEKALANNPDLLSSAATLKNAFEAVTVTGSVLWPQLSFSTNASNRCLLYTSPSPRD